MCIKYRAGIRHVPSSRFVWGDRMALNTAERPMTVATPLPELRRTDAWWVGALTFFVVFSAFALWATFRAFENGFYDTRDFTNLQMLVLGRGFQPLTAQYLS